MRSIAHPGLPGRRAHGPNGDVQGAFVRRLGRLVSALGIALTVRRERLMLLNLDDRALRDVGFDRGTAHHEALRSFWDIPVDRLRQ